jgi:hypothetical protein
MGWARGQGRRRRAQAGETRWTWHDGELVEDGPWWGLERRVIEVQRWRLELEIRLAGSILSLPPIGLLRADEFGVTPELFDRADALLMYQAARCCRAEGTIEDKTRVLLMARCALQSWDLWDRRVGRAERGFMWSDESLVSLACGDDGPGDVTIYAPQLIDLDRRLREGRELWRRMDRLFDEIGYVEALDGRCRATLLTQGKRQKVEG